MFFHRLRIAPKTDQKSSVHLRGNPYRIDRLYGELRREVFDTLEVWGVSLVEA